MVRDKYSYHEDEDKALDELRAWSKNYFNQVFVYEPETIVPIQKKIDSQGNIYFRNFDIHGKIINS